MQALKRRPGEHATSSTGIDKGTRRRREAGDRPRGAMEDRDRIAEPIDGADMLFMTAGHGRGTGTGAAPVIAESPRS